jgi:hypothetical protein
VGSNVGKFFIIHLDCDVPNYKNLSLQKQKKANMNKLNTKVKYKSSRESKIFHTLYIYSKEASKVRE